MSTETIIEEGIVLESMNGKALISLIGNENCHSCGAKPFCKSEDSDKNKLSVIDPYGVFPGDEVKISVEGKTIVMASFSLYGLPLILLILSILLGLFIFSASPYAEALSFLISIVITAVYYFILFRLSSKKNVNSYPKIIFVRRHTSLID